MRAGCLNKFLFNALRGRDDVEFDQLALAYEEGRNYWFSRLASLDLTNTSRTLLIRTGVHGDEAAGPLTILNHCNEIFNYAHGRGTRLIIYPLGNPAGFDHRNRYSFDCDWEGFVGNNDFVRYVLPDGTLVDEIETYDVTTRDRWRWSSHLPSVKLPRETSLMHACLKKDLRLTNIVGLLDLHQDYITRGVGPLAYHYAFGNLTVYQKIIKKLRQIIAVSPITTAAGYASGVVKSSDENGFIVRHDGSLSDLAFWLDIPYNVAVETTGCTTLDIAMKVNLVWIKGFVDLISNSR